MSEFIPNRSGASTTPYFDRYPPEVFALLAVCIAASTPGISLWMRLLLSG